MDKKEEAKNVAVKAIMNGDYDFAAEILENEWIGMLMERGLSEDEALKMLGDKLEEVGSNIDEL